jgi:Na+-transporting NADH:ubiquinone oxidoreductase subunit NqrD
MQSHLFWGIHSPLSAFTGVGLIVIASGRIVSALICLAALLWTNALTLFVAGIGRKALPEKGHDTVLVFVASFASFLFYFFVSVVSPFQAMENTLCILLCPVFLLASGLYSRAHEYDTPEMVFQAVSEALVLGALVLALALIREPLGSGSVSLPGFGLIRFTGELSEIPPESRPPLEPIGLLKLSSGAFIILGYGVALYRHWRNIYTNQEDD